MSSTIGGDDPQHDIPDRDKNRIEKPLREEGKRLKQQGKTKEGNGKIHRANEISRRKSRRAHQQ